MNWDVISGLLQTIETVAVVFAVVYGWQQLKDARKEIHLGAIWGLYEELSSEKVQEARHHIYLHRKNYQSLNGSSLSNLSQPDLQNAYLVCNTFDRVGYLISKGLVSENLVLDGYSYPIAKSWIILKDFVIAIRETRQQPSYQRYFEALAAEASKNYTSPEEIIFNDDSEL